MTLVTPTLVTPTLVTPTLVTPNAIFCVKDVCHRDPQQTERHHVLLFLQDIYAHLAANPEHDPRNGNTTAQTGPS